MANAATKQTAPPSRMALANITKGKQDRPIRVLIYGTEGIGKSTWAASAPSPIFLPVEDGTGHLDTERLPQPESWADVLSAIDALTVEPHNYKTLVIDTVDAAESLNWAFLCERDDKADIEAYGYAKGYIAALSEWRIFVHRLEQLQRRRGMGVILTAHSWIKTFKNPEGDDFDRYEMKLHAKAAGLLKEWSEDVLFAQYETLTLKEDKKARVAKGVASGARIVRTVRTAAWDAKNRHGLPETLPLDFDAFMAAMKAERPADPEELRKSITAKLETLGDEAMTATVGDKVKAAGDDAVKLAKIENRLNALLNERAKGA